MSRETSAGTGKPGATPSTFHSFSISNPFLLTQFYPKFVSRIIGGGAVPYYYYSIGRMVFSLSK